VLLDAATCQEIVDRMGAVMPRARELLRKARRVA
jgi:putrescine aminotransferase